MDKVGGFIGTLTLLDGNKNAAIVLLEEGLASIHNESLKEYQDAQSKASSIRRGVWSLEPVVKKVESPDSIKRVYISDIIEGQIYVQVVSEQLSLLESLMKKLSVKGPTLMSAGHIKPGQTFVAHSADKCWCKK